MICSRRALQHDDLPDHGLQRQMYHAMQQSQRWPFTALCIDWGARETGQHLCAAADSGVRQRRQRVAGWSMLSNCRFYAQGGPSSRFRAAHVWFHKRLGGAAQLRSTRVLDPYMLIQQREACSTSKRETSRRMPRHGTTADLLLLRLSILMTAGDIG
jgi:hypothetical protein